MIEEGQRVRLTTGTGEYTGTVAGFRNIYCCGKQVVAVRLDGNARTINICQFELLPIEAPAVVGHA